MNFDRDLRILKIVQITSWNICKERNKQKKFLNEVITITGHYGLSYIFDGFLTRDSESNKKSSLWSLNNCFRQKHCGSLLNSMYQDKMPSPSSSYLCSQIMLRIYRILCRIYLVVDKFSLFFILNIKGCINFY